MQIQEHNGGRLIDQDIYLGEGDYGDIRLRLEKGDAMNYESTPNEAIDYPGEYDIGGVLIQCIEADGKLSYTIRKDDEVIALLQNAAVLEVTNFEGITMRACMTADIQDEIVNLELDGNIVILEELADEA